MLCFSMSQRKIHTSCSRAIIKDLKIAQKNLISQSCPHNYVTRKQIHHIQPPNPSMLCVGMFPLKFHIILFKGNHIVLLFNAVLTCSCFLSLISHSFISFFYFLSIIQKDNNNNFIKGKMNSNKYDSSLQLFSLNFRNYCTVNSNTKS